MEDFLDNPNKGDNKRRIRRPKKKSFIDELFDINNKENMINNKVKKSKPNENIVMVVDRLNIYKDFVLSLLYYLNKYYIDDGSFDKDDERKFHVWCYNKVCDDFIKEGLNFKDNKFLEEYFFKYHDTYFFDELYRDIDSQVNFWKSFFNMSRVENKTSLTNLVNLYVLFSTSIDNEFEDVIKESEKILEKSLTNEK